MGRRPATDKDAEIVAFSFRSSPEIRDMMREIAKVRGQAQVTVFERAIRLSYDEMIEGHDSQVSSKLRKKPPRK